MVFTVKEGFFWKGYVGEVDVTQGDKIDCSGMRRENTI